MVSGIESPAMAKEKKGKKSKKDSAGPRDAVRGAVESTFQKAAGGASRAQDLLDDVATTLKSLRDANLVETLESVRDEVQTLARRVAALELRGSEPAKPAPRPAATRRASTSTTRSSTARKPAARKPAATKSATAAKPAARKPAASKSSTAAKPAARKPAASKSSTAAKPAARKPAARKPAASRSGTTKPSS